jgi:protein TonB
MKTSYKRGSRERFALIAMLFGAFFMGLLVVAFHKPIKQKEPVAKKKPRYVEMKRERPKPKPRPKPRPKPKAPPPNVASLLSGLSLNLPEFQLEGFESNLLDGLGEDGIMSEGSVDAQPRVVSRSAMPYPDEAMKKGIKGYVVINMLIDKSGSVEIAKILEASPPNVFDTVALNGVRGWRFIPAKYKGKPVKMWAKQKIRFDFN